MRGSAAFRAAVAPGGVLAGPWVRNELWRRARAVPSLDLRFAENKSLGDAVTGQSLVTFTRASSGTYVGSDGLIKTATTDAPRFDHNPTTGESLGLLVEESRTNLLLQSEDFSTTWTVNAATVGTAITAPDATITAQKIEEDNTTAEHRVSQISAGGATTTAVCMSVFAKAAERTKIRIAFSSVGSWSGGGGAGVIFDLAAGTAAADSSTPTAFGIIPYPGGWYHCFTVGTPNSSITPSANIFLFTTASSYAGTTGSGAYLWGAQLEAGPSPTSYISTTTAMVTRAADVASIEGANFNTAQFARASTATFYNSSGIITTANVDIPRNNYNPTTLVPEGLLLEPQRQNLLLHSEDVNQHFQSGITASLDATTAPDNATTADEIAPTATTSEHFVGYSVSVTAGKTYAFSAYVKPNGAPAVRLRFALTGFDNAFGSHDFATNTTTPGAANLRVIAIQNGWYRIEGIATSSATAVGQARVYPNSVNSWLGVPAEAMYVWGAQLEEGPDATSYIPTTTTEVTRSADVPAVSPWYRQDEGTVFADAITASSATSGIAYINNGSISEAYRVFYNYDITNYVFSVRSSGTEHSSISSLGSAIANTAVRIASTFKINGLAASRNGGSAITDTSAPLPAGVDRLQLGATQTGTNLNGTLARITFWPQALPSRLQEITQ